ncbi:putative homing endonuclease [Cronobacter phage vB_CsaM_GAP161]|uniref:Putative homing endonuclease n=1 Tax=Cronobacter phage vB_CsaM_GAP161 TaxID=1141138 RepID=K4F706_9CAUD|nr:putative homing endonuclease [Cronobacter phage vB_CsaM_GAP161]AFC22136.1 putative homing endonuclease [Cronobacter phage vB_CsaM_GAP161]
MQKSYGSGKRTLDEEKKGLDLLIPNLSIDAEKGVVLWKTPNRNQRKIKAGDVAGSPNARGYHIIKFNDEQYRRHRLVFYYVYGYLPEIVDHVRGVEFGDGISNLRELTQSLNAINRKVPSTNSSGYIGVSRHETKTKGVLWRGRITVEGKKVNLGLFTTPEEAHQAVVTEQIKRNTNLERRS